jgi:predicted lipid carrier protein YhbT
MLPASRPLLRRLLGLPGRLVPYALQRPVLALVLNEAFREPLKFGELAFLEANAIRIRVHDLGIDWLLTVRGGRFLPLDRELPADVCISGDSLGFALLATRRADPDTLFFQRRIRVEGDTELGLGLKNTMDSMDWDDLPAPLRRSLQALGLLFERLQHRWPAFSSGPRPGVLSATAGTGTAPRLRPRSGD